MDVAETDEVKERGEEGRKKKGEEKEEKKEKERRRGEEGRRGEGKGERRKEKEEKRTSIRRTYRAHTVYHRRMSNADYAYPEASGASGDGTEG